MSFIKKTTEKTFQLTIYVKPNSHHQKIEQDGDYLAISLKSKARRNKANKELINLLKSKLDISTSQIRFVAGLRNEDKILEVKFIQEVSKREMEQKLVGN
ncbi:MAG: DUF167 domain-containing protein [Promethearchaeota archaeon]|nr:MAG: DUF167 domain-containing protein [Candidatus Lokiarchaeota archaeon]